MATINLGSIKFNWKGDYAAGTAYAVDDVVNSSGTSYVCIAASTGNAPPNATYWNVMAQGGTDISTTLTTQGDILYRDGSGLQRLAKGTAGKALLMNSSANAPEWGDVGGTIKQYVFNTNATQFGTNNTSGHQNSNLDVAITPTSSSNKIIVISSFLGRVNTGGEYAFFSIYRDSTNLAPARDIQRIRGSNTTDLHTPVNMMLIDSPSTTSAITYKTTVFTSGGGATAYVNEGNLPGTMLALEVE